ncbi:plasma membrane fusion protein prm1, partial [Haplosporangium sp. Z 27]
MKFTNRPFPGLGAKLSQAFVSYTVIFLLISTYRLYLIRNSVDTYIDDAEQALASDCLALQRTVTNLASIPNFAAQSVNNGLVSVLDSVVSQIGYSLEIILSGFLETIDFVIGILTGTWRCFLENLSNSDIPLLSEIGTGGVEALDQIQNAVVGLLALPLNGLEEIIQQQMENPQIEQFLELPVLPIPNVEFCTNVLNPVGLEILRQDIQEWILYGIYGLLILTLMTIFGNMVWIAFLHKRSKTQIERMIRQFKAFSEESARNEKHAQPSSPESKEEKEEIRNHQILKYCSLRVSHMARHPLVFRLVEWSSKRLFPKDKDKQSLYFWFVHYVTNPQAVTCLFLGLYGLILVYSQIAVMDYVSAHYRPALTTVLTNVVDLALESVNNAMSTTSITFANKTNTMLQNVEIDLNANVFNNIIRAAQEMNGTLVQVQSTLVQGIQAVFGDGAFGQLVLAVLQCLLFEKLTIVEIGLTWIQENAKITLPRLSGDILMMDPEEMNKLVAEAVNEMPMMNSSEIFEGFFEKVKQDQREMLPVYYGLIGIWVVVFLMGVPVVTCLTEKNPTCKVCLSTQTPEGVKNIKRNTGAMVTFLHEDGKE